MSDKAITSGTWVQIESTILDAGERAEHLPEETRVQPLMMWVKGFLKEDAEIGDTVTVKTAAGRELTGKLVAVNPPYKHNFGRTIPELLPVGDQLRELVSRGEEI